MPLDYTDRALWRQSQLTAIHGLFQVTKGIYQLRGIDLSNIEVPDTAFAIVTP